MSSSEGPVLLAYDGSESSAAAIAAAAQLLKGRQALVCHCWTGLSRAMLRGEPAALPGALRQAAEELDAADREAADRIAAEGVRLAVSAGFETRPRPLRAERKIWRTLLEEAEREGASAIIAGAHGLSGVGRTLLGSVSTGLVHHSPRPVLVVPAQAADLADGPLLLCWDGSEPATRAIAAAAELCLPRDALVLNLWVSWTAQTPALAGTSGSVRGMAAELDEIAEQQSKEVSAAGVELARAVGLNARQLSERAGGPIWASVLETAGSRSCSCIVVGSRGLTGLSAALGSVSSGVVHHSRRPVLVVPGGNEGQKSQ